MARVIGIDAGTVSLDLCGLDAGTVFLDRSMPTREALASPGSLIELLESCRPLDLIVAPSGYGVPLAEARSLSPADLALAFLAAPGESGGIGGLRALIRALAGAALPVVLTPAVIHLQSVPVYRKVNRVDMGTADKVCAVALALHELSARGIDSFILLELGGAFSAAITVVQGRIVDGLGGTSGPLGAHAAGALDGEVAFLAGHISKAMLFTGGVSAMGDSGVAWDAYRESALKAVAAMMLSAPSARTVVVSGRYAERFPDAPGRHLLRGFASVAKAGAQGAALIADGLAGGAAASLVASLGIRKASGTVLDHLHVISARQARLRLGLEAGS